MARGDYNGIQGGVTLREMASPKAEKFHLSIDKELINQNCFDSGVKGTPSCPSDASVGLNCLFAVSGYGIIDSLATSNIQTTISVPILLNKLTHSSFHMLSRKSERAKVHCEKKNALNFWTVLVCSRYGTWKLQYNQRSLQHTDACHSDADCLGRENGGQPSCCMTTCGYKICYQY